ncbi:Permease of the drug/metabolite transporter (DMT) superfamily [Rubellimicrobium mesophilum DSM 19309]|uniref:Permease of the drug/metabolite transporter (DMT) superfamily n=1 Tax=Rubellimicrobium mesophilum DSM 19309 TaxID=442562 RepID=A0A017HSY2_9RHOB|nr:DMT family transporter [Rubellimicrobium mesophilum]EYD76869.1 Permease of the drug/metabolite transporter (DMT) superfamily [Rubellimicrobium mesophilum DSM 19309]
MTRLRATLIGFGAVLLWALLAVLTVRTAPVPPLLHNALTFGIAALVGLAWGGATRSLGELRRIPWGVHAFGVAGLFGYHLLYFSAMRLAPPAEAGLIAYLWPLFIVLLSGLLPGERLRRGHLAGGALAFGGVAMIVLGRGGGAGPAPNPGLGFVLAFGCAMTWAVYSVVSRQLGRWPTVGVTVSCAGTAALSLAAHLLLEETLWPASAGGWLAVALLGLGPVGLAFFLWDVGVKRGDIQLLGVASYAAPLLSTLALVAGGAAEATWGLGVAALLVAGGAALAAWPGRRPPRAIPAEPRRPGTPGGPGQQSRAEGFAALRARRGA